MTMPTELPAMFMFNPEADFLNRQVAHFLAFEAYLLDHGQFDPWLDLYTDDAVYWVPLEANQKDPINTHSLIYDDKRLMQIRIRQQGHPRAHAQSQFQQANLPMIYFVQISE